MYRHKTREEAQQQFAIQLTSKWQFRLFLLTKMPIALLAGILVRTLTTTACTVSVPYKWLSQNPFRSIYFATQAMAAEMSTGSLALMAIQNCHPAVSMLVTQMHAEYTKKATERIYFTCADGPLIFAAVDRAISSGKGEQVIVSTQGKTLDGLVVSQFSFTWSFKSKK